MHRGKALVVGPDGRLAPDDAGWLIGSLITHAGPVELAYADHSTATIWATPEQRCTWASRRGRPEAHALCPVAPAPVIVARPPPPPPPPPGWHLVIEVGPGQ